MQVDPRAGVAAAVGVVPAAVIPLAPRRRGRVAIALLGALIGVSVLVGSLLATIPWLAVAGLFALSVGAALLAARRPLGKVALMLGVPLTGVGLSYPGLTSHVVRAGRGAPGGRLRLRLAGVAALARARAARPGGRCPAAGHRSRARLRIRLGLAGALTAAIGFALDLDHVGWAVAAALLVMRPSDEALRLRAVGRPVSVCVGAVAAIGLVTLHAPRSMAAVAVVLAVVAATATAGSRWYVTPAFTTFLVFLMLISGDVTQAEGRFWERVGETLLGAGVAGLFGLLVPRIRQHGRSAAGNSRPRHGRSSSVVLRRPAARGAASRRASQPEPLRPSTARPSQVRAVVCRHEEGPGIDECLEPLRAAGAVAVLGRRPGAQLVLEPVEREGGKNDHRWQDHHDEDVHSLSSPSAGSSSPVPALTGGGARR